MINVKRVRLARESIDQTEQFEMAQAAVDRGDFESIVITKDGLPFRTFGKALTTEDQAVAVAPPEKE